MTGADAIWRVLAPIDLSAAQAGKDVENALDLASALVADLTLLSIVDRRQYADGVRHNWPSNAFGSARPELDIGRCGGEVALSHQTGNPARGRWTASCWRSFIFRTRGTEEFVAAAKRRQINLLVAGRAMAEGSKSFHSMVSIAARIGCPLFSMPLPSLSAGSFTLTPVAANASA